MIQFNLLPDVKLEFIKAERTKRLAISISVLASVVALAVFVLLVVTVDVLQKKNLSDLNGDIKSNSSKLENSPNLNKILTVQNQLSALDGLHDQKPDVTRLYKYLGQVTPSGLTISNVTADFDQDTISITGNSATLDTVNTFVDTLKFTTFKSDQDATSAKAFSDVVLASFNRSSSTAGYTITFSYVPDIFDITKNVNLTVPQTVTTRSVTEQPTALFKSGEAR